MIITQVEIASPPGRVREVASLPPAASKLVLMRLLQLLDFAKIPEWHSGLVKSITPMSKGTEDDGLGVGDKLHCVMEGFTFDSTITVNLS